MSSSPSSVPSLLQPVVADGLGVTFGGRTVLSGVDLVVPPGRPTALVGENGSGKSTLLRALAGRLPSRAVVTGTVRVPADLVLVGQEPPFADIWTVGEVRRRTLAPMTAMVRRVEELAEQLDRADAADEYAAALDAAVTADAWDAERRAVEAAARLGLGALDDSRVVASLSGGQRMRLALASVMTTRPSALLLDEPSNHLDDAALELLADFVRSLPGVVLLASHDRVLLDDVASDLIDLEPGEFGTDGSGGRRFSGGWSAYEEHRAGARARWEQIWVTQQEELARLREATTVGERDVAAGRGPRDNDKFVHAFKGARVQGAVARRRRDAERRLAEAEAAQVRKPRPPLSLRSPEALGDGGRVHVRDLVVLAGQPGSEEGGAPRLHLPVLDVVAGEHLLVTGGNGAGKSTLLGVLSGRIAPSRGEVDVRARVVAELEQDVRFADPSRSPRQVWREAFGPEPAMSLQELGLVRPADLDRAVGLLSVGQRRRLGLAVVLARRPDLLLLDEPTNHLSLSLAGELEEAVGDSRATVVLASHDRWLRRRWQGRVQELVAPT